VDRVRRERYEKEKKKERGEYSRGRILFIISAGRLQAFVKNSPWSIYLHAQFTLTSKIVTSDSRYTLFQLNYNLT